MGFDKRKIKQICLVLLYVAVLVLMLIYSDVLISGLGMGLKIFMPFLIGAAIAFILNIPMNAIEKKLFKKWQGKTARAKRPISLMLAIAFVLAILALVIGAVVPQLRTAITMLGDKIPPFLEKVIVWLEGLTTDYPEVAEQIEKLENLEFDWGAVTSGIGGFLSNGVTNVITSTVNVATSIVGGIANVFIAIVFAIYILSQKEKLQNQGSRILDAYVKGNANSRIRDVLHRLHVNFTNFICGQCLEAVILGLLFLIFMSIFRMPYAVMIGTLIAFTALIPIVGAFIGCGVGAFMILIDNPLQALWFVILFLIIQQLEGNLIYPRVVGNSVGLPSIWVLMSVSVGGSLFGVVGMLVFIPLMSTLYSLLRDDVNQKNHGKYRSKGNVGMQPALAGKPKKESSKRQKQENEKTQESVKPQKKQENEKTQEPVKPQKKQENVKLQESVKPQKKQENEKTQESVKPQKKQENTKKQEAVKQLQTQKTQKSQKMQKEEVAEEFTSAQIIERLVAEQEVKVKQELEEQGLPEVKLHEDVPVGEKKPQNKKNYKKRYYYNNKKQKTNA